MTDITPPNATAVDALIAMDRRIAGLTAAMEGFAARQQELHARDYSPELANLQEVSGKVREALVELAKRPTMALTPASIGSEIERATSAVRKADREALGLATRDLRQVVETITSAVASARAARIQNTWLAAGAAVAVVIGIVLGTVIPPSLDQAVPESWHWPEERAASVLERDGWSAGERMMQVADPRQWQNVSTAVRLSNINAGQLQACAESADKAGSTVSCTIKVVPPGRSGT
jgi:hypothetical protein